MSHPDPHVATATFREVVQRLSAAQKTSKGAPAYSRFVNRPLGKRLAALAYLRGLTPNAVTGLSALCSFSGIAATALVRPSWALGAFVTIALVLGYALDAADGQLARLQGTGSASGEYLDHIVDALKISCLHAAVLVSFYRFGELRSGALLLVPVGFAVVAAVLFFAMILVDQMRRAHAAARPAAGASTLRSLLVLPTDYGLLCVVFLLLGRPSLFLAAYALLFGGSLLFLCAALPKWYREVAALGRPRPADVVPQPR